MPSNSPTTSPKDFTPVCTTELGAVAGLESEFAARGAKIIVFIIGPDKRIKLTLAYPMTTGRNFAEILRALDALQLTAQHQVATPADWQPGDDVIITSAVSDEEAQTVFPGFQTVKPYLRTTKAPQ